MNGGQSLVFDHLRSSLQLIVVEYHFFRFQIVRFGRFRFFVFLLRRLARFVVYKNHKLPISSVTTDETQKRETLYRTTHGTYQSQIQRWHRFERYAVRRPDYSGPSPIPIRRSNLRRLIHLRRRSSTILPRENSVLVFRSYQVVRLPNYAKSTVVS